MRCQAANNPFRVQQFHALSYRGITEDGWRVMIERLWARDGRGALVGPHGHGKTTLLKELESRLKDTGVSCVWLGLNTENRKISNDFLNEIDENSVIFFDGAEQLNPIVWKIFLAKVRFVKGLIITTHQSGRLPLLYSCTTSTSLLDELLDELAGDDADNFREEALQLYQKHQGNLREVWFELYDSYA